MARLVCGPKGTRAALATLTAPHDGQTAGQIHVARTHRDHLTRPDDGLQHEADGGLVAAVPELPPGARLDQRAALLVGQLGHHLDVQLRRLEAEQLVKRGSFSPGSRALRTAERHA